MTPESKVKAQVVKLLKEHDIYYFFPATHGYGRSGVPDIVCCFNSQFLAIECKAGKGKTTALQEKELKKIRDAGGDTFVINETNIDTLENYLSGHIDIDLYERLRSCGENV
jgi:Holliday junction resolvase